MRDDRVGADEDRQAGHGRIPHRVQHRLAAHQLGRDEHRRVVDRDRGEERAAADRREPLARRDLAGGVVRETGREVERDRVGSGRVDDRVESCARGRRAARPSVTSRPCTRGRSRRLGEWCQAGEPAPLGAHVARGTPDGRRRRAPARRGRRRPSRRCRTPPRRSGSRRARRVARPHATTGVDQAAAVLDRQRPRAGITAPRRPPAPAHAPRVDLLAGHVDDLDPSPSLDHRR